MNGYSHVGTHFISREIIVARQVKHAAPALGWVGCNFLPAEYRSLVLHTYIEGKTNEQVARLLRCPVGSVKGRLSRARDLLRARLSLRGWDQDEVRYR